MSSQLDTLKEEDSTSQEVASEGCTALGGNQFVAYFSVCNVCEQQFLLQEDLFQHMVTHALTHPVSCRNCIFRCETSAQLALHIKTKHVVKLKHRRKPSLRLDHRWRCAKCGIDSFPSYTIFKNHHLFHLVTQTDPCVPLERLSSWETVRAPVADAGDETACDATVAAATSLKLKLKRSSCDSSDSAASFKVVMTGSESDCGAGAVTSEPASLPADKQTGEQRASPTNSQSHNLGFEASSSDSTCCDETAVCKSNDDGAQHMLQSEAEDEICSPVDCNALSDTDLNSTDSTLELPPQDNEDCADLDHSLSGAEVVDVDLSAGLTERNVTELEHVALSSDTAVSPGGSRVARLSPPPLLPMSTAPTLPPAIPTSMVVSTDTSSSTTSSAIPLITTPSSTTSPTTTLSSPTPSIVGQSFSAPLPPPPPLGTGQPIGCPVSTHSATVVSDDQTPAISSPNNNIYFSPSCSSLTSVADGAQLTSPPAADTVDNQPVIRMAAIAANIPDERSFRQEVVGTGQPVARAVGAISSGATAPVLARSVLLPQLQQRPPPMLSLATSLPSAPVTVCMPPLRPRLVSLSYTAPVPAEAPAATAAAAASQSVACFVCRVLLPSVRALQDHLVTVHCSLQCTVCMFKASSVGELRAHCFNVHQSPAGVHTEQARADCMFASPRTAPVPLNTTNSIGPIVNHVNGSGGGVVLSNGTQMVHHRLAGLSTSVRRGRPPLMLNTVGALPPAVVGRPVIHNGPATPMAVRMAAKRASSQMAPDGHSATFDAPSKRRSSIPIQSDKSDCQVIAVQRRQQGVPRIQSVEGAVSATASQQSQERQSQERRPDVTSVLANRGISITPAASSAATSSASASTANPRPPLPQLPVGISLTPASASTSVPSSAGFAVPLAPAAQPSSQQQQQQRHSSAPSRPCRPPTVDLTVDSPARPASLACRFCPRQFTTNMALQQHEKSHSGALRCRLCGATAASMAQLEQHVHKRHPGVSSEGVALSGSDVSPPAAGLQRQPDLVVPVFDLALVSKQQLEQLGVRGFLPVSQVNQRQGQLGVPIISLEGLAKSGPSPKPTGFFNLGPLRHLR